MEKAKVHQGLWCCHCCWWWVPLESSCKLLRVLLSAGVGPTWQRLISYTKFGSESWKKDVDMFASSAISWLLCLSSSDMLLTATTNVSSSAINRLLLLYYLQWLTFQEARYPPWNCVVIHCTLPTNCVVIHCTLPTNFKMCNVTSLCGK